MLEDSLRSAIGLGAKLKLRIIKDTVLKRFPIDSTALTPDKRQDMAAGIELAISDYKIQDSHCSFDSIDTRYFGHGYAFLEHVEIVMDTAPLLTEDQLVAIAPDTPKSRITALLQPINNTLTKFSINTPLRICHFLAQICHESDGLNTNEEYASGADYEGRTDLGNTQEGDGERFKGRSLIQITGRFNYKEVGDYLGIDLISNPERLGDDDLAPLGAGWFWNSRNLNVYADRDDFASITHLINGGENGWNQRLAYLGRAKQVFKI